MKILILLLLFTSCIIETMPLPEPACFYDFECWPGEICNNGFCEYSFSPLLTGEITVPCTCWNQYIYIGQQNITNMCESGWEIVRMCEGCCEEWMGMCVKPMLGKVCI